MFHGRNSGCDRGRALIDKISLPIVSADDLAFSSSLDSVLVRGCWRAVVEGYSCSSFRIAAVSTASTSGATFEEEGDVL